MSLPKFRYLAPSKLKDACVALKELGKDAAICAGGTELIPHLKFRLKLPAYLLSLKNIPGLNDLHINNDKEITIGAMSTLGAIARDHRLRSSFAALVQCAEYVASPQIRNRATIGGNICLDTRCWYYNRGKQWRSSLPLCHKTGGDQCHVVKGGRECYALFQADTVPGLLILDAKVKLADCAGERIFPLSDFYTGRGETANIISPGEILTEVRIPRLKPYSGTAYCKYRMRGSFEFPYIGVASSVTLDSRDKSCTEARFALIGHAAAPLLMEASSLLKGADDSTIADDVIDRLLAAFKPVNHMGVSAPLKRRLAPVLIRDAFNKARHNAMKTAGGE